MRSKHSRTHLSDSTLLHDLASHAGEESSATTTLLADIAEFDARRLYVRAGYPSTFAYCVEKLHLSEGAAYRRTQAARAARRFPVLFEALESGDLHLTAVNLLAPYLRSDNVRELVAAARHKCKAQILELLARRFPKPDLPESVCAISSQPALAQVDAANSLSERALEFVAEPIQAPAPIPGRATAPDDAALALPAPSVEERARTMPVSADRFGLQLTMDRSTHDKLRHAQELLGHSMRPGDLAGLLDRALDALIEKLEKQKFAASSQPGTPRRSRLGEPNPRTIPAHVKRAVWQRDRGQCTFASASGHRCDCRRQLEFDHVEPIARGGVSSVSNLRLRCRAHNQYEAECAFGAGFMGEKRAQARRGKAASHPQAGPCAIGSEFPGHAAPA